WAKHFPGPGASNWGYDIAVDASGNVYSTGQFNSTVDFDPNADSVGLTAIGGIDIYVHKMVCIDTSSAEIDITSGCNGYEVAGNIYAETGTYTLIIPNTAGCDSTITLNLTIEMPEAFISVDEFKLSTTEVYKSYQWL